ncbi:MAG: four helix bundle suffix domain-containing protein [Patescibacteria group bacterium]
MPQAGYEYLLAYKITVPIYDYTVVFCNRAIHKMTPYFPPLSSTRTYDQMVQSGRSGMTNILEGNKQQSLAGYIKLSGVARGSIEELMKDYFAYGRQHQLTIWPREKSISEIREIGVIWNIIKTTPTLPDSPNFPHLPNHPESAVNLMITLTKQAGYLQDQLITSLKEKHMREGGFSEKLLKQRLDYRKKTS